MTRVGIALLTAVAGLAMSACGTGRISQTANQQAAVPGANVDAGPVALRGLMVAYNEPQGYPIAGSAPLIVRVFNNAAVKVWLVAASAPKAAGRVEKVTDNAAPPPEASATPSPGATPTPSAAAVQAGPPCGSLSTPRPAVQPPADALAEVGPSSYALLVPGNGAYLQLTDLLGPLTPGSAVDVTFAFMVGDSPCSVAAKVPFGIPLSEVPRATPEVEPAE